MFNCLITVKHTLISSEKKLVYILPDCKLCPNKSFMTHFIYPTPLRKVQITRETSTNISRYLCSNRQVLFSTLIDLTEITVKNGRKSGYRKGTIMLNTFSCEYCCLFLLLSLHLYSL